MKILHYFIIAISIVAVVLGILILPTMIQPKGTGFTNGEDATLVLGQPNFTTHMSNTNATATGSGLGMAFELPGLAFDSSGNLWVVDGINSRILMYPKGTGFINGESATLVLGQPNFATFMPDTSATGLRYPIGLAFDSSGNLWVSDSGNSRILMYPKGAGFTNGEDATLVLGQSSFTSFIQDASATGLRYPIGLAFDSSGNLWVSDGARILMYPKSTGFTNGQDATLVLGQPNFATNTYSITATGLSGPFGLAFDSSGNLWVADSGNNRVLEYNIP